MHAEHFGKFVGGEAGDSKIYKEYTGSSKCAKAYLYNLSCSHRMGIVDLLIRIVLGPQS